MKRLMLVVAACLLAVTAQAQPTPALRMINLITFGGGVNLPIYVAQRQGFFAKHGVDINLRYTPNSVYLMTGLLEGRFDIATSSIDNLVAYQEGQGEAPVKVQPDLVAFMGLENGFLNLVALPDVKTIGDLRGKDIGVDALTTGFAFVAREMMERAGIKDSDVKYVGAGGTPLRYAALLDRKFAATLLVTPFDLQAEAKGYTRLGNDRDMTPALAKKTYDLFVDKKTGLYRDLKIDMDGFTVVLGLRAKYGQPKRELGDPSKYVDLELYRKAFPDASR